MVLGGFEAFGGLLVMLVSVMILWLLRPRNGVPHLLATVPYLETAIPIAIVAGLILGFSALIAGTVPMMLGTE